MNVQAKVIDVLDEGDRYVVSVRFTGTIRESKGSVPESFDETWHLVKGREGRGGWVLCGIQQVQPA